MCKIVRFEGQTHLFGCKPDDFRKAIEEAYSIENGFLSSGYGDKRECGIESELVEVCVAPASDLDCEYFNRKKVSCCRHSFVYLTNKLNLMFVHVHLFRNAAMVVIFG